MCGGPSVAAPTMQQRSDESLKKIAAGNTWMGVPGYQPPGSGRGKGGEQLAQPVRAPANPWMTRTGQQAAPAAPAAPALSPAQREAQAEIDRRTALSEQIAAQEKAMKDTQTQIQQNLVDARTKQAEQEVAQRREVADLQAQQIQRTGEINASGQAVGSSLRILAVKGGKQGPTAAMAPQAKGRTTAARNTSTGLRIGSTMTGSGVGTNLGT